MQRVEVELEPSDAAAEGCVSVVEDGELGEKIEVLSQTKFVSI